MVRASLEPARLRWMPSAVPPTPSWIPTTASPVVVRFGRLGDMVLLQPLLQFLHRRFGQPCTLVARGPWTAPLYSGHADVAHVIELRHAHRPLMLSPERWRAVLRLRRLRQAPVYICEPEPRALRKVRRMLALAGISEENCVFLTDLPTLDDEHWIDRLLRFGNRTPAAFAHMDRAPAEAATSSAPAMQLGDADRADRAEWLQLRGWDAAPLVLLQPANKRTVRWKGVRGPDDDKWWPVDRWASLARRILAALPDSQVLLCGAPSEAMLLRDICRVAAEPRIHAVADTLPLRRLMALQEIAHSMISVDTGPAHLASALGCPLVVLFGKVAPAHWLPRGASGSRVLAIGGPLRGARVDALSVDEVFAAWARLPARSSPQDPGECSSGPCSDRDVLRFS